MDTGRINSEIARLSADIQKSAAQIMRRRQAPGQDSPVEKSEQKVNDLQSVLPFYGFKVSYLNAESSFSLSQISLEINGEKQQETQPNAYAVSSYRYSLELLNEPKVLIDFMHKNNQSFNYMV